jgi:hypothetical protein
MFKPPYIPISASSVQKQLPSTYFFLQITNENEDAMHPRLDHGDGVNHFTSVQNNLPQITNLSDLVPGAAGTTAGRRAAVTGPSEKDNLFARDFWQ